MCGPTLSGRLRVPGATAACDLSLESAPVPHLQAENAPTTHTEPLTDEQLRDIESLAREKIIDPQRIFLLGFSQSCALNYRFAFTHANVLRLFVGELSLPFTKERRADPRPRSRISPPIFVIPLDERFADERLQLPRS